MQLWAFKPVAKHVWWTIQAFTEVEKVGNVLQNSTADRPQTKKQFLRLNKELENIKRAINKTKPRAKPKREYIPQPIESEDEVETETPITHKKIPSYYFI